MFFLVCYCVNIVLKLNFPFILCTDDHKRPNKQSFSGPLKPLLGLRLMKKKIKWNMKKKLNKSKKLIEDLFNFKWVSVLNLDFNAKLSKIK